MNDIYEQFMELMKANQFLQGGAILGAISAVLIYAKSLPMTIWGFCVRRVTMEIEVSDREAAFLWIDRWLSQNNYLLKRARRLSVKDNKQTVRWGVLFTISPGLHYLWFKRHLLIISRDRQESKAGKDAFHETLQITLVGRNRQIAFGFIEKCRIAAHPIQEKRLTLYKDNYGSWNEYSDRGYRDPDTIILDKGLMESVSSDLEDFLKSREWYEKRGIPYKRGYLFDGPPGNGKTSAIISLASKFKYDVCLINMSKKTLNDDELLDLMTRIPANSFLIIEDIDAIFLERNNETDSDLSFSGLLNAIDGIASPPGLITFMTTNHRDRLDTALLRPGRIDMSVTFTNSTANKITRMFNLFYGANYTKLPTLPEDSVLQDVSMATVQGHFIGYKHDERQALKNMGELWNS